MNTQPIASFIDHTLLSPLAAPADIARLCGEAVEHQFKTVCVPPCYVKTSAGHLSGETVGLSTVIGFPLGYTSADTKFFEARKAIDDGAHELDVVMNSAFFKAGDFLAISYELSNLTQIARQSKVLLKVIIETANLSVAEIEAACTLCADADVDFVKTSTGFVGQGATIEAVALMRKVLPSSIQVKASGGIRTYAQALEFIRAGATRLGTSAGIALVHQQYLSFSSQ